MLLCTNIRNDLELELEYFIAKRISTATQGHRPSVMERVATVAVALSVATMVVALAVVYGFKSELGGKLTGFTSDALLANIATLNNVSNDAITNSEEVRALALDAGALHLSPYITKQGVVRNDGNIEGVMLKGVDSLYKWNFIGDALVEGSIPRVADSLATRDILISSSLAARVGAKVGARLELIFSPEQDAPLRRDLYRVSGLYSTGLEDWDNLILITDIRNLQRLNGWAKDKISGYEMDFSTLEVARQASTVINEELLESDIEESNVLISVPADELYPAVFDWLKTHDVNALVTIIIMLIVAGFNMATALLIMVFERTRMIAVLKSMGMNNRSLQKIFIYRALRITVMGLAAGNIFALGFCLVQQHFKLIELDASGYMLQYVPISLGAGWITLLNAGVVVAILLLMTLPTQMVSRVKLEKSLKFD